MIRRLLANLREHRRDLAAERRRLPIDGSIADPPTELVDRPGYRLRLRQVTR